MSEEGYGLVMPFVVVSSKGGPWDDQAYVAGYEMGKLDSILATKVTSWTATINTWNVPQADLIAMRHGYAIESEESEDAPSWTFVTLRRIA